MPEVEDGSVPGVVVAVPVVDVAVLVVDDIVPGVDDIVPVVDVAVPVVDDIVPRVDVDVPGVDVAVLEVDDIVPGVVAAVPGVDDIVPGVDDIVPGVVAAVAVAVPGVVVAGAVAVAGVVVAGAVAVAGVVVAVVVADPGVDDTVFADNVTAGMDDVVVSFDSVVDPEADSASWRSHTDCTGSDSDSVEVEPVENSAVDDSDYPQPHDVVEELSPHAIYHLQILDLAFL